MMCKFQQKIQNNGYDLGVKGQVCIKSVLRLIAQFPLSFLNAWCAYSKTCLKQPLKKKTKIGFQDQLSLNAGKKYCRMLQGVHSAILLTFIKLPFVIKIFVLSIFEKPLKTSFTVFSTMITYGE